MLRALRLLLAGMFMLGGAAAAQELYRLEAPPEVAVLLGNNLPPSLAGQQELGDDAARVGLVRRLRRDIPELLATEGYFSPQVDIDLAQTPFAVRVQPGPQARIRSVGVKFEGLIVTHERFAARLESMRADWGLPQGAVFRQARWSAAKSALLLAISARDFPTARLVSSEALVDREKAEVDLRLVVDSGPAFKLGNLEVIGLQDYPPGLVERYSKLREGDAYSLEGLLELQSVLQSTPYFAAAEVTLDTDPAHADAATVHVRVSEAKPRGIVFSAGYSSNTGFRGEIDYRDANWLGKSLQFNGGISLEQKRQSAAVDVFLPPEEDFVQYGVGGLAEASYIERLRSQRVLVGISRSRPRGNIETRIGLSAQVENNKPDEGEASSASALALNWSWTQRHVDSLINPRTGYVLNVQFGGGLQILLSDANFFRSYARFTNYWSLSGRDVIIARAEGGYTATKNPEGVPQEFLYRTGGAQTVRGYNYLSLGVQDGAAVVGGRYLAVMSLEHNHWFGDTWGSAIFFDAGNASNELEGFTLKKSVGVGVRYRSPAGPIAFDLGYAIDDRKLRPNLSIAIAF